MASAPVLDLTTSLRGDLYPPSLIGRPAEIYTLGYTFWGGGGVSVQQTTHRHMRVHLPTRCRHTQTHPTRHMPAHANVRHLQIVWYVAEVRCSDISTAPGGGGGLMLVRCSKIHKGKKCCTAHLPDVGACRPSTLPDVGTRNHIIRPHGHTVGPACRCAHITHSLRRIHSNDLVVMCGWDPMSMRKLTYHASMCVHKSLLGVRSVALHHRTTPILKVQICLGNPLAHVYPWLCAKDQRIVCVPRYQSHSCSNCEVQHSYIELCVCVCVWCVSE